jgi:hypothetical protein
MSKLLPFLATLTLALGVALVPVGFAAGAPSAADSDAKVVAGKCNGFTGATTLGTYKIVGVYLPVCGPRPAWDQNPNRYKTVLPYAKAGVSYSGYQCAELPVRWLHKKYGLPALTGNGSQIVNNYYKKYKSKFSRYADGTKNHAPVAGDVISFWSNSDQSDSGHTGVVISSSVNKSGNGWVKVAEQNYGGSVNNGVHKYTVSKWKVKSAFLHANWLHRK